MKKRIAKRVIAATLCLLMAFSVLAGCGSSSSSSSDSSTSGETADAGTSTDNSDIKIMFSMALRDQFLSSMEKAGVAWAEANGVTLDVQDANDDISQQLSHVQAAVAGGYDAIIVNLVNTDNAADVLASAGDLPVVFVNRNPGNDVLVADKIIYVGSDENYSGGFQAEYLAERFKAEGKTEVNLVLFEGALGQEAAVTRTASVKAGLEEAGITANYVFEDTANWERSKAQEMFIQFLGKGEEFDGVICNNDEMALGVIEAMQMQGLDPSSVPIVGIDATADGCKAIQEGTLAFTVYQSATGQGEGAVQAATEIVKNGTLDGVDGVNEDKTVVWIDFEPVDADNVADYLS